MSKGCVIFDFDGVIADTEAVHLAAYNATFREFAPEIGGELAIAPSLYYRRYIVYGDREAISNMLRDHGRPMEERLVERLMEAKGKYVEDRLGDLAEPLPGVRELLEWLEARNVPRAICSGARRTEIEPLLDGFKLRHHFDVIVTIEDVKYSKPEPEGYNKAFDLLNLEYDAELEKEFSLVIEDSEGGCTAGKSAGLRVLGVATSLPLEKVKRCATFAVKDLSEVDFGELAGWLGIK